VRISTAVPEGPGINDNGSGSAVVLEAALRLARGSTQARAGVRFAFWGAEERGLIGSRHHVGSLSEGTGHWAMAPSDSAWRAR
jgi:Zn-dependent M28 family amino/carboxypeptidase